MLRSAQRRVSTCLREAEAASLRRRQEHAPRRVERPLSTASIPQDWRQDGGNLPAGGAPPLVPPGRSATLACHERRRSEEHTSELPSLMRISYAAFCLKKKKKNKN